MDKGTKSSCRVKYLTEKIPRRGSAALHWTFWSHGEDGCLCAPHLKNERKFATASLTIAYSGIKFFYSHTAPRDWTMLEKLQVRRDKRLPDQ